MLLTLLQTADLSFWSLFTGLQNDRSHLFLSSSTNYMPTMLNELEPFCSSWLLSTAVASSTAHLPAFTSPLCTPSPKNRAQDLTTQTSLGSNPSFTIHQPLPQYEFVHHSRKEIHNRMKIHTQRTLGTPSRHEHEQLKYPTVNWPVNLEVFARSWASYSSAGRAWFIGLVLNEGVSKLLHF